MKKTLGADKLRILGIGLVFIVLSCSLGLQACGTTSFPTDTDTPGNAALTDPAPSQTSENTPLNQVDETPRDDLEQRYHPIWGDYPPPSIDPATPIPTPIKDIELSDEILVWVLLGSDAEPPFKGRTEAIHLVFIQPRFSKASLVSIPGDLFVYIPGYTMQRINTAYAVGGIETLRETLEYNFGVKPSRFVLAHPGDFQWLVDDMGGLQVTVFYPLPQACGGIPAGVLNMDGALALCYASYQDGINEIDRMRRQQQLLQLLFQKLTRDGNLIKLPVLYATYEDWIRTDLSLAELLDYIPLALRLADKDRIGYYLMGWEQIKLWDIPGGSQAQVFLPQPDAVKVLLQQAIDDIMTPQPLTNQVQTLEAQLTLAYLASPTPVRTISPSATPSQTPTLTMATTTTGTTTTTPTVTLTPTITTTVVESITPTPTPTPPGYP